MAAQTKYTELQRRGLEEPIYANAHFTRNYFYPLLLNAPSHFASLPKSGDFDWSKQVTAEARRVADIPVRAGFRRRAMRGFRVRISSGGCTDVGRIRSNNEDSFRVVAPLNLFVLSDGMGGEAHGEVASALAIETISKHCLEADSDPSATFFGMRRTDVSEKTNRLASAVTLANRKIFESASQNPQQRGMGATVTALWLDGPRMSVAHVGDSRAYLLRTGALEQLTQDHSLVAEQVRRGILTPQQADNSEMQSVLIRALGTQQDVEVDADEFALMDGDTVLLCSDGLTRMVTDPEIASTLLTQANAQSAAEQLVTLANENGGEDNVTVVVLNLQPESNGLFARLRRWMHTSPDGQPSGGEN